MPPRETFSSGTACGRPRPGLGKWAALQSHRKSWSEVSFLVLRAYCTDGKTEAHRGSSLLKVQQGVTSHM